jgi:hypothetical protein
MNVNPGGKQVSMRDGWFIHEGQKINQPMVFPTNHPQYRNQPKSIKAVLTEQGLYCARLRGKCKNKCDAEATECCNKRILELQADFVEQKSLVQETIKGAGHLCLFFLKFHCELNFIEYFWAQVKRFLRDNCDYTFNTFKENMLKALESVPLTSIRRWEHRMYRWMEAYRSGLGTSAAQLQVKRFGSAKFKSHRRVPETIARAFD